MTTTATISPLTRIEGHLSVRAELEAAPEGAGLTVASAHCEGEMFRGFENILQGRDPMDAQQITQRICGVCPISHGLASCRAQEMAYGIRPTRNGRLLQNLILAANYLQSHILHFYHLAALDFVDVTAVLSYEGEDPTLRAVKAWVRSALDRKEIHPAPPFLPRYEAADYIHDAGINHALLRHYVEALDLRALCHEMCAIFGAKMPHSTSIVPGGCTQLPTLERVLSYASRLKKVRAFIEDTYFPDVAAAAGAFPQYWEIGAGYGDLLCYGVFELSDSMNMNERFFRPGVLLDGKWERFDVGAIAEDVRYSRFSSAGGLHPSSGRTEASPRKSGAYSWLKAPRYRGRPMEVGPLARVMVNYHDSANGWLRAKVDEVLAALGVEPAKMFSVMGRHLCRALECRWIAERAAQWIEEIELYDAPAQEFEVPENGSGYGLVEAPRGALGHWLTLKDRRIQNYQCVVPTTWNCSPRDDRGQPGPVERALQGTPIADPSQPIEAGRVVRSFDPCIACAVH